MSIKKSYEEIVAFLKANENKKVSTILEQVLLMAESKKASKTFIKDSNDKVVAIYCYYHKQWELLIDVPYGSKANSSTGYNTMCKVGTSTWTKKQRDAKKAKSELIDKVSIGEVMPDELKNLMADIESTRLTIDDTNMPEGFGTIEEFVHLIK